MPTFMQREIHGKPSSARSAALKARYLEAPLMVDIEYIRFLTESNRHTDGMETLERRAADHAFAIGKLSPVIQPLDRIAGNKTRFIRGAIPYANYAAGPFLKELSRQEQDAQQKHMDQGSGGGIAAAMREATKGDFSVFSGKFLISGPELSELRGICEYWKDRCFMASGERLWRSHFDKASFIDEGWTIGLYTAPHEPCPEGRIALDFDTALERGYLDIIRELDEKLASFRPASPADGGKLHFWRAAKRSLEGGLAFARGYAEEASRLATAESEPVRKAELLELAEICERVPALPPRNFREAVQSFWFTYLLGHMEGAHLGYSPGRLDSILQPWFDADPGITREAAVELFEELFVKMTQIEYIASLSWQGLGHGNLYQNLILGGLGADGEAAVGEVSMAILQAQIDMQMTQPTLSVWYDESLPQDFLDKAAECVKTGVGYPAFFNQKVYVEHEARATGLPLDLLRKHAAMGGCTEPTLQGMSYGVVQAGFVNHGKLLDLVFNGGVDPATGIRIFPERPLATFADALSAFKDYMHEAVRNWQRYWNYSMIAHRDTVPLVFCSVFVRDCIGRGLCMDDGGAIVNGTPTTLSSGLVNVANSLAAFRALCFDEKICTVDELRLALREDWSGRELLRRRALEAPKWGNDDPRADDIFLDLFDDYCAFVGGQDNYLGKPYDPSMLAISTPVPFGKACGAFPDGRRSGEPLADGVTSPYPGTDLAGPTAVIRSSSRVDHRRIRGGLLNLKFHPSALSGESGSRNLLALIRTYFEKPGFHMQFNVVDSEMLRDAQAHPEKYRDLVVRVAGFSAYWVEMSKALQDQVIRRTEHSL
jgi:formate C-acetyltransferase/4-hydroxyphenylacetate decarboxylase large subunit